MTPGEPLAAAIEEARRAWPGVALPGDVFREELFLADPPALAGYGGHGDLRAWLRVAVLHLVLNITSRESREVPTSECFFEAIVDASPSSEAAFLRRACRQEFEEAFVAAVAGLPAREKSLLRYAFNDKLTIDEVGAIFRVHRGAVDPEGASPARRGDAQRACPPPRHQ